MRHVLVTGGSSGIGLAVADLLLERGDRVCLVARGEEGLAEAVRTLSRGMQARAERILAAPADVTDGEALSRAVAHAASRFGTVDVLVASAGIVEPARFLEQDPATFDRQISVNLTGVANSARSVLPGMREKGGGRVLIVSSGAGLIGIPGYSAYCASKFALRGLAAALRAEMAPAGISVSICFPPDTLTPQFERELPLRPPEAQALIGRVRPREAAIVARAIVAGMDRGRREIHFGLALRLLGYFGPFAASYLDRRSGAPPRRG
ncbi:SDR family oxidoreductase [Shinella sp. BYT-45]|uniref:SDR family oxidoreductase n=1 Tax=Shinella sp. BYT-45 TaxID=3377377 RepID=UPI003980E5CE